jgi:XTP/dITP diphosphohydrolase
MKICLATNNTHKIEEIRQVLSSGCDLVSLQEIGCSEELPETGHTLEANSLQKAQYIYQKYKVECIADDSGLEIEELEGRPGVDSAHYAGPQRDAQNNMEKVLSELIEVRAVHRRAVFKTVITYIDKSGHSQQFIGTVAGTILEEKRGSNGFGYDPIFEPDGFGKTFAEMNAEEKNSISHRARALQKFKEFMGNQIE